MHLFFFLLVHLNMDANLKVFSIDMNPSCATQSGHVEKNTRHFPMGTSLCLNLRGDPLEEMC